MLHREGCNVCEGGSPGSVCLLRIPRRQIEPFAMCQPAERELYWLDRLARHWLAGLDPHYFNNSGLLTMPSFFQVSKLRISMVALACCLLAGASADAAKVDFESEIKPIFAAHCLSCHDEENEEGGFIIDRETTLDYVIVGDADESDFFSHLVTDDEDELMPPADAENPLSQEQITLVKNWINEGASWPEDVTIEGDSDLSEDSVDNVIADDADTGEQDEVAEITPQLLKNATGSLHPAAIHLPIGLLLVSGLFAFLSLRGNFVMSDCAYYCLWIGALGSIGACVTGWFYSPMEHQGDVAVLADLWDTTQDVFLHRTWALGCSVAALLLALMAMGTRARDPDDGVFWKLGTICLAAAIGWVGHLGGELTYGKAHYKDLNAVVGAIIPALNDLGADADESGEPDAETEKDDASDSEPAEEADEPASEETDSVDSDAT